MDKYRKIDFFKGLKYLTRLEGAELYFKIILGFGAVGFVSCKLKSICFNYLLHLS